MAAKENIASGIPLSASPATLHRKLLSCLTESSDMPLDVFEKGEVVREEHHCVPAYCFSYSGTATFMFDAGNIQTIAIPELTAGTRSVGAELVATVKSRTKYKEQLQWTLMNGNASIASALVFAPGNKELVTQIQDLYMQIDPGQLVKQLVDIQELDFPPDVETYDYNLPQLAAFDNYSLPKVEEAFQQKAEHMLRNRKHRDVEVSGSDIQKEMTRVFLGLYRVVYRYAGHEYSMWATGDGQKVMPNEELPVDQERKAALAEKQRLLGSIPMNLSFLFLFGFLACAAAILLSPPAIIPSLLFTVLAIICGVEYPFARERGKKRDEERAKVKEELVALKALFTNKMQQFKEQKKALRGIYENVTGDPAAFYPA
jgi:hypothetical protein